MGADCASFFCWCSVLVGYVAGQVLSEHSRVASVGSRAMVPPRNDRRQREITALVRNIRMRANLQQLHQNGQLLLPNTASVAAAQTPPTCTIIHSSAQSTQQWDNTCTFTSPPNLPTLHPPCGAQASSPTISALEQATPDGITENTTDPSPSVAPVPGTTGACNWLLADRIAVFTNHSFV